MFDEYFDSLPEVSRLNQEEREQFKTAMRDPDIMAEYLSTRESFSSLPDEDKQFLFNELQAGIKPTWGETFEALGASATGGWKKALAGTLGAFDVSGRGEPLTSAVSEDANKDLALAATTRERYGTLGKVLFDFGSNMATQGPLMTASIATGNPALAFTQSGLLAFGQAADTAAQAGYGTSGQIAMGLYSAVTEMVADALTLKSVFKIGGGRPILRSIVDASVTSAVSNGIADIGQGGRDYLVDELVRTNQKKLFMPEQEDVSIFDAIGELAKRFAQTAATSAMTGAVYSMAGLAKLRRQGITPRVVTDNSGSDHVVMTSTNSTISDIILDEMKGNTYNTETEAQVAYNKRLEGIIRSAPEVAVERDIVDTSGSLSSMAAQVEMFMREEPMRIGPAAKDIGHHKSLADAKKLSADLTKNLAKDDKTGRREARKEVWKQTGWYEIVPGQWGYELDDSQLYLRDKDSSGKPLVIKQKKEYTLGELISHPELEKAYPEIFTGTKILFNHKPKSNTLGSFDPNTNTLELNAKELDAYTLNVLIHEIQHNIQKKERWARGGSPGADGGFDAYQRLTGEIEARLAQYRDLLSPEMRKNQSPEESLIDMLTKERLLKPGEDLSDIAISKFPNGITINPPKRPAPPNRPLPGPPPLTPPSLPVGKKVSIDPNSLWLTQTKGRLPTAPLEATIAQAKTLPDGTHMYDIKISSADPRVIVPPDAEIIHNVPEADLRTSLDKWRTTLDQLSTASPGIVKLVRKMISGDKPIENMSREELKRALGNTFRVVQQIKKGKAFGSYTPGKDIIKMAEDLHAVDPRFVANVLAHEVGHFIDLVQPTGDAAKAGMGKFIGFRQTLIDELSSPASTIFSTLEQQHFTGAKNQKQKMEALNAIIGQELDNVSNAWSLMRQPDADFSEKMADFLSVLINKPTDSRGKELLDLRKLAPKTMAVFDRVLQTNPQFAAAWKNMIDTRDIPESARAMFVDADKGMQAVRKMRNELGLDLFKILFVDDTAALLKFIKDRTTTPATVEALIDKIDGDRNLGSDFETNYMNPFRIIINDLRGAITPDHAEGVLDLLDNYSLYNRIINDRQGEQSFIPTEKLPELEKAIAEIKKNGKDLGMTEEEIAEAVQEARDDVTIVRRFDLMNPRGLTPETAEIERAKMEQTLGPENYQAVVDAFNKFSEHRRKFLVDRLAPLGIYDQQTIDKITNNENYVKFQVVHWLLERGHGGQASSGLKRQTGTLADIASPVGATAMADYNLFRAARGESLRRQIVNLMQATDPDQRFMFKLRPLQQAPSGYVKIRAGGHFYALDNQLGAMFRNEPGLVDAMAAMKRIADGPIAGSGETLRKVFTMWNPFFWARNSVRDVTATALNLPGWKALKVIPGFVTSLNEAWNSTRGASPDLTPVWTEMTKKGLVTVPHKFLSDIVGVDTTMTERVFYAQLNDPKTLADARRNFSSAATFAQQFVESMGETVERASKIAAYKYVNDLQGYTEAEKNYMVRRLAGTPSLTTKGMLHPGLSNVFYFYNPRMQGMIRDYEAIKRGDSSVLAKRVLYTVASRIAPILMMMGAAGEEWQEWIKKVPTYALLRGWIIPLGETADGKAVFTNAPEDAMSSFLGAAFSAALIPALDEGRYVSAEDTAAEVANVGYGEVPSISPIMRSAWELGQIYLTTNSIPERGFGVGPVIPKDVSDMGKTHPEFVKRLGMHLWNNLGGATVHRFNVHTEKIGKGTKDPNTVREAIFQSLESWQDKMIFQLIANRITITDAGLNEATGNKNRAQEIQTARDRFQGTRALTEAFKEEGGKITADSIRKVMTGGVLSKEHLDVILSKEQWPYFKNKLESASKFQHLLEMNPALAQQWRQVGIAQGDVKKEEMVKLGEMIQLYRENEL